MASDFSKNAFLTTVYCVIVPFLYWFIAKRRPDRFNLIAAFLCIGGIALVSITGDNASAFNMGDVLTLIEKAQTAFDEKKAMELEAKLRKDEFTLEDYLEQFEQMKNMGSMQDILGMIPGIDAGKLGNVQIDEKQMARTQAIIRAMTPQERRRPDILNASRRKRIARGSGTTIQEVNRLLNQYEASRKMMKQLTNMGKGGRFKKGKKRFPFGF